MCAFKMLHSDICCISPARTLSDLLFLKSEIKFICACYFVTEGMNISRVSCIFMIDTNSLMLRLLGSCRYGHLLIRFNIPAYCNVQVELTENPVYFS